MTSRQSNFASCCFPAGPCANCVEAFRTSTTIHPNDTTFALEDDNNLCDNGTINFEDAPEEGSFYDWMPQMYLHHNRAPSSNDVDPSARSHNHHEFIAQFERPLHGEIFMDGDGQPLMSPRPCPTRAPGDYRATGILPVYAAALGSFQDPQGENFLEDDDWESLSTSSSEGIKTQSVFAEAKEDAMHRDVGAQDEPRMRVTSPLPPHTFLQGGEDLECKTEKADMCPRCCLPWHHCREPVPALGGPAGAPHQGVTRDLRSGTAPQNYTETPPRHLGLLGVCLAAHNDSTSIKEYQEELSSLYHAYRMHAGSATAATSIIHPSGRTAATAVCKGLETVYPQQQCHKQCTGQTSRPVLQDNLFAADTGPASRLDGHHDVSVSKPQKEQPKPVAFFASPIKSELPGSRNALMPPSNSREARGGDCQDVASSLDSSLSPTDPAMDTDDAVAPDKLCSPPSKVQESNEYGATELDMKTPLRGNSSRFLVAQAKNWTSRLEEAKKFREKFGHCRIPHDYPANQTLATWAKRQRYQYKLYSNTDLTGTKRSSSMTPERIAALEGIGFCWNNQIIAWMDRYNELCQYVREHGDSNVPSEYKHNKKLAIWVKCQRRQYKLWRAQQPSTMRAERVAMLEEVGFRWAIFKNRTKAKKAIAAQVKCSKQAESSNR